MFAFIKNLFGHDELSLELKNQVREAALIGAVDTLLKEADKEVTSCEKEFKWQRESALRCYIYKQDVEALKSLALADKAKAELVKAQRKQKILYKEARKLK